MFKTLKTLIKNINNFLSFILKSRFINQLASDQKREKNIFTRLTSFLNNQQLFIGTTSIIRRIVYTLRHLLTLPHNKTL